MLTHAQLKAIVDWARAHLNLIIYDAFKAFVGDESLPQSIYEVEETRKWPLSAAPSPKPPASPGCAAAIWWCRKASGDGCQTAPQSASTPCGGANASKSNGVSYPVQKAAEATFLSQGKKEIGESIAITGRTPRILLDALSDIGLQVQGVSNALSVAEGAGRSFRLGAV